MASVQFKGVNSVIDAYERRKVPAWSLWQGSQFMFKYEGDDMEQGGQELQSILEVLSDSTNAIYTLKVYEDLPGGKIKDKTPHDGSFNFRLNADNQEITNSQYGALRNQNAILEKLESLEKRLNEKDEEEDDEPPSKLGLIGEILNDPGTSQIVLPLIMKAFGIGTTPSHPAMRSINGIPDDDRATLNEAMQILKTADPKLPEHLMKLAKLSKESPDSFKFLLQTLDSM